MGGSRAVSSIKSRSRHGGRFGNTNFQEEHRPTLVFRLWTDPFDRKSTPPPPHVKMLRDIGGLGYSRRAVSIL